MKSKVEGSCTCTIRLIISNYCWFTRKQWPCSRECRTGWTSLVKESNICTTHCVFMHIFISDISHHRWCTFFQSVLACFIQFWLFWRVFAYIISLVSFLQAYLVYQNWQISHYEKNIIFILYDLLLVHPPSKGSFHSPQITSVFSSTNKWFVCPLLFLPPSTASDKRKVKKWKYFFIHSSLVGQEWEHISYAIFS